MAITACDVCRGRGKVIDRPCDTCAGAGSIAGERAMEVDVPAGIEDGARLRIPGRGAAGEAGGRPGDLYVEVRIEADPRFDRHGPDLVHRLHIGLAEAALGTSRAIPSVDGDADFDLDIPAGTQPGSVFKLSKMGMPRLRRRGRGDLLVEVLVDVPETLTADQEAALRSYAEASGELPAPARRRRAKRAR
jgi:molecular chaperone DnaJ